VTFAVTRLCYNQVSNSLKLIHLTALKKAKSGEIG
jgi:hypothetical protein